MRYIVNRFRCSTLLPSYHWLYSSRCLICIISMPVFLPLQISLNCSIQQFYKATWLNYSHCIWYKCVIISPGDDRTMRYFFLQYLNSMNIMFHEYHELSFLHSYVFALHAFLMVRSNILYIIVQCNVLVSAIQSKENDRSAEINYSTLDGWYKMYGYI